jgi:monoamine oxidase
MRIIIAGAGMAGLAAARELEDRGFRAIIIEARDRIGGRVVTIRDGFAGRQHAEGGADLIESDHEAVCALAKRLHLTLTPILGRGFGYYGPDRSGRVTRQSAFAGFASINEPLASLVRDYKLGEQRWDGPLARRLADQSVAEWVKRISRGRGRDETAQLLARFRGFRGLFLADPEELSLLALVDFFAADPFGGDSKMFRVPGGNDQLATRLAATLRAPVLLRSILRRVRMRPRGVSVTVETPKGQAVLSADALVITLPPPPLRRVEFDPQPPPQWREAIRRIRMGPASRMLLQFDRPFWRRKGSPSLFASDQPTGAVWDGNEQQRGTPGILSLLAGGGASAQLAALVERDGADAVVQRLAWLGKPGTLLASRLVRWDEDEWAGGGYVYFERGFDPRLRDWLARPFGRVVFAGEHTSERWQGYVNGAVESGQRAAAEVQALLLGFRGELGIGKARGTDRR